MLTKFPFKFPNPNPNRGLGFYLITYAIKKLLNIMSNNKETNEKISYKEKFNSNDIEEIIDYSSLLNKFTTEIESDISTIEEKIILECTKYYDELILLVRAVEDSKKINLQSKRIVKTLERLKRDIKGDLIKNLYKNISLDNESLKKILSLPPGELKKNRLIEFKNNVIKQVLGDFISDIKISLEDLSEDISNYLNEILSDISNNNTMLLNELTMLENSKQNEEKAKELLELSKEKIILCDEILKI